MSEHKNAMCEKHLWKYVDDPEYDYPYCLLDARNTKIKELESAVREIIYGNFDGETCYHLIKDIIKEKT